jgi:choline kinase
MTYIILAAGKGCRLHPITVSCPKTLFRLDEKTTVIERMTNLILKYDDDSRIYVVVGFMYKEIMKKLKGVTFIHNPFFEVTNSMASLWFARELFNGKDDIVIINGDIVTDEKLMKDIVCKTTSKPLVLIDSSVKSQGDYNVQVCDDKVVVMSKELEEYFGEYAGITKIDAGSAVFLNESIGKLVDEGQFEQWYENALVQMIFRYNFSLYYIDVSEYSWTELDSVSDLVTAKRIIGV